MTCVGRGLLQKGVGRDEIVPRRGRPAQAGAEGPARRRRSRGRKWWRRRVPPGSLSRPGALVRIQIQTAPGRRERREAAPGVAAGERRIAVPPGRGPAVWGGGGKGACHDGTSSAFLSLPPSPLSACAAEWGSVRQPELSGSLARCAAPGHNNALRSPAASEQHDDEGQAVPHCTIALLARPVVSSR